MQNIKRIRAAGVLAVVVTCLWVGHVEAEELTSRYAAMQAALDAELVAALPDIDANKKAAYLESRAVEIAAEAEMKAAQKALGENRGSHGLLNHRKGWIARATQSLAEAKETLQQAEALTGDAEAKAVAVTEAREALAKIQENHDTAVVELKKSEAAVAQAKIDEPPLVAAVESTEAVHSEAKARTMTAVKELGLGAVLRDSTLDAKLAKYVVLSEAQPARLAAFADQGRSQRRLVESLLDDDDLLLQMVVADGAQGGRYGEAMEIYSSIQKASRRAQSGVLQRLAVAIALEHAVPVKQRNAAAHVDAPDTVDPVKRYLHFEKAFLAGALDAAFEGLTVWDLRFVVDGDEPDEMLAWGREMLRNYRPDHIATSDDRWRYVALVRTDIRYGSQDNKHDQDDLQFYQNILKNGGICGRRAFIGRFILRAFGVPTTARPQPGHAALVRWTPDGWVPVLGAGWGSGSTRTRYSRDLDFLANTQARANQSRFLEVKRAQWIGDVLGEKPVYGFVSGDPGFWYGVSLYHQKDIHAEAEAVVLAAVGEELGEANESDVAYDVTVAEVTDADQKISVSRDGVITIPAAASSAPTGSTSKILFMDSVLGGKQMHYSRTGMPEDFEYTFDAPTAGKYALTARVVTPSWQQNLLASVNGAEAGKITLPHTVGMWGATEPITVALVEGQNVLRFSHVSDGYAKGFSIRDFTLRPVR